MDLFRYQLGASIIGFRDRQGRFIFHLFRRPVRRDTAGEKKLVTANTGSKIDDILAPDYIRLVVLLGPVPWLAKNSREIHDEVGRTGQLIVTNGVPDIHLHEPNYPFGDALLQQAGIRGVARGE